jgi:signal transduction histidine kinase
VTATTLEPGSSIGSRARAGVVVMVSVAIAVVVVSLVAAWPWVGNNDMYLTGPVLVLVGVFLLTGSMIAIKQPDNAVGWVLNLVAIFFALLTVGGGPRLSVDASGARLWLSILMSGWWAPPIFTLLSVVPLIFPDGKLPSRRWRIVIWAAAIGSVLTVLSAPFDPHAVDPLVNPIGSQSRYDAGGIGAPIGLAAILAAMVGMVRRYRRATGVARGQLKLLVSAVVVAVVTMILNGVLIGVFGEQNTPPIIEAGLLFLSAAILAAAIGFAILRHKLFDINVVISKALVYGALALAVTGIYFGIVVGIGSFTWYTSEGEPNQWLTGIAIGAAVLLFDRLRVRAQHLANRLVYGRRATPYEVLSHLSEQLRETVGSEDLLAHMARSMAEGTGAKQARVWMRTGGSLWTAASWPGDLPRRDVRVDGGVIPPLEGASLIVPVEHAGDLLGALSITKAPNDPLTTTEERLVTDLGSQAGLVLRNARLTTELRARLEDLTASRQRLVKAQDEERRRLERNLHDGAQQLLVALKVKLGLAAKVSQEDQIREMLVQLQAETGEALDTVRELARGIYPPLLASDGLAVALRSQADKATLPVAVEADGLGRYAQEAEAAVYFCVLEALQNVQKYARATRATVTLRVEDGTLTFVVADDGGGFDPATTPRGSGTQNMADRLGALDGTVEVGSEPGAGTTVSGSIPVEPL